MAVTLPDVRYLTPSDVYHYSIDNEMSESLADRDDVLAEAIDELAAMSGLGALLSISKGGTSATSAADARSNLGAAASGANSDITSLSGLTTPLSLSQGGVGANTAAQARTNLGAAAAGDNGDITSIIGLTTPLSLSQGGVGADTAEEARANLGAATAGDNEDITSLSGLTTPLSVEQGGTGSNSPGSSGNVLVSDGTGFESKNPFSIGVPPGAVMYFANTEIPVGWLPAEGGTYSRTTYANLYQAIGVTYGAGDGSTTFRVPDLRGEFIRGWDNGRGVDVGRGMGSSQADMLKAHTHTVQGTPLTINGPHPDYTYSTNWNGTNTSGSTGGTETRPRNIAMRAFIKY